jgi:hypothetical protein
VAAVKVIVEVVPGHPRGFFCAGRCWPEGRTEAILEDLPNLSVEQQLAQLRWMTGGQELVHDARPDGRPPARSPALLVLTIVDAVKA